MSDALKLRQPNAGVQPIPSASDEVNNYDSRTLGRDLLAVAALFFVIVTYHIQNPLLQFGSQFGSAFRNSSLQVAMLIGLAACSIVLVRVNRNLPSFGRQPLQLGAAVILFGYTLVLTLAILFGVNLSGVIYGIPAEVFTARLTDDTPTDLLNQALAIMTVAEYLALISVVILWQPWTRLAVYRRALRKQGAAIVVGIGVIVLWEVLINVLQIQQFLLPRPSVIGATFAEVYPRLISAGWSTFQNAFWGFTLGCGAGILTGMVSARFVSFSKALLPVAIAINAIPIIAFAPIFNLWFGLLSPVSKIAIVAVTVYFPAMISTVRGLTSVDPLSLELMNSYAASPMTIFRKLRLPSALPFIFAALKVATTLSMIAAIVSEYFGGSTAGLGFRIRDDAGLFKYPEAWSAIFIAALYGILFYVVVSAVERALLSWHISFREK